MAQTIKIKRSSANGTAGNSFNTPTSLENGELAYLKNNTHQKLYIGNPGGSSGDISVIGGKDFTDKLDLIGAANGSATADARVVASSTNLGVVRIGSNLSIATTGVLSADNQVTSTSVGNAGALMESDVTNLAQVKAFDSSDYATAAQGTTADNALPRAGGTMTGNLVFGDNNKIQLGGTSTNLEIYNDGTKSYIQESATGNLIIKATDFEIHDGGGQTMVSFDADGSLRFYDQSAQNGIPVQRIGTSSVGVSINGQTNTTSLKFGNETVIVSSVKDEDDMNSDSDTALATQQSIKKYVDDNTATAAVTDGSTSLATGDQIHTFVNSHTGDFDFTNGQIELSSGSTITLGASDGSEGVSVPGTLTVSGDLNVTGDVNSTSVTDLDVTDKTITVGVGQTSAQSSASGLQVDRTDGNNPRLLWSGTQFEIDDGDTVLHGIIHEGNSATQTYTIDGGTF